VFQDGQRVALMAQAPLCLSHHALSGRPGGHTGATSHRVVQPPCIHQPQAMTRHSDWHVLGHTRGCVHSCRQDSEDDTGTSRCLSVSLATSHTAGCCICHDLLLPPQRGFAAAQAKLNITAHWCGGKTRVRSIRHKVKPSNLSLRPRHAECHQALPG